jgi:hypothetical protein
MIKTIMESMGMVGFGERHQVIDASTPTAAVTSSAYARALEGATATTKASIAKLYPRQNKTSQSSMNVHRGSCANPYEVIEAILPHQFRDDEEEFEDTRDQPMHCDERMSTGADRDGHAVRTAPVNKLVSPTNHGTYSQDDEAKHLLQSILNLDLDVSESAAAIYHYFETKKVDDEVSSRGRATQVIHSIKDELRKGNSKPAYQFLETAKSVLPILLEEKEKLGLELEDNIFSKDSEDSVHVIHILTSYSESFSNSQHDEVRSISEQTAAIFQFLDDAKSFGTVGSERSSEDPDGANISRTSESNSNIFRILEEQEEVPALTALTPDGLYTMQPKKQLHGIVGHSTADLDDPSNFNAPDVDEMDLEFVENFDLAFSEFLLYHPKLVAKNPKLAKNLRIYKLQKFLEYNEVLERTNLGKLNTVMEEKVADEETMHLKLKDAMRKKAARQIFLEAEVNGINWNTKLVQSKLRWKLLKYSEDRAKRQSKLREQFAQIPLGKTRQDLIRLIPEGPHSKKLQTAIKASFIAEGSRPQPDELSVKQGNQLRKIQVENSVMNSEILMLNQKLALLQKESKKLEWVQSTLVELDPMTMQKFKKKFEKNEGVKV